MFWIRKITVLDSIDYNIVSGLNMEGRDTNHEKDHHPGLPGLYSFQ
jgi:hypothetical protein